MTDPFESLIDQLGFAINMKLHVDKSHACTLKIHQKLSIQMQMDMAMENLLIATFISELPPGKFRENVLAEALKANNLPDPRTGILGYLSINNQLTLHQRYRMDLLDGHKLQMFLAGFIDYADLWREAIEKGLSSPAPISGSSTSNPFNLKR